MNVILRETCDISTAFSAPNVYEVHEWVSGQQQNCLSFSFVYIQGEWERERLDLRHPAAISSAFDFRPVLWCSGGTGSSDPMSVSCCAQATEKCIDLSPPFVYPRLCFFPCLLRHWHIPTNSLQALVFNYYYFWLFFFYLLAVPSSFVCDVVCPSLFITPFCVCVCVCVPPR